MKRFTRKFSFLPNRETGGSLELSSISSQWFSRLQIVGKNIESAMLYNREMDENALARERIEKNLAMEREEKERALKVLSKLEDNYLKLAAEFQAIKQESLAELEKYSALSMNAEKHEHEMELDLSRSNQETASLKELNSKLKEEHFNQVAELERRNSELAGMHAGLKNELELLRAQLEEKVSELLSACQSSRREQEPATVVTPSILEPAEQLPGEGLAILESTEMPDPGTDQPPPEEDRPETVKQPLLQRWLDWWTKPVLSFSLTNLSTENKSEEQSNPDNPAS